MIHPPIDDYVWLMDFIVQEETQQALAFSGFLRELFAPASVIDVGCGPGIYLAPFINGGAKVLGIDGSPAAGKVLPATLFEHVDLRDPWTPPQRYDLAMCIEVAEHLHEEFADTLMDTLTRCSDRIVFTAATPGQGGYYHWNEQPHEYWIDKFKARGYDFGTQNNALREHLGVGNYVAWLRNNAMLFERRNNFGNL
ncbi:class I SAM-dependent methyltransferase [bacterium]|nr:class I SAM-dependent methyltransferase [bacterium]